MSWSSDPNEIKWDRGIVNLHENNKNMYWIAMYVSGVWHGLTNACECSALPLYSFACNNESADPRKSTVASIILLVTYVNTTVEQISSPYITQAVHASEVRRIQSEVQRYERASQCLGFMGAHEDECVQLAGELECMMHAILSLREATADGTLAITVSTLATAIGAYSDVLLKRNARAVIVRIVRLFVLFSAVVGSDALNGIAKRAENLTSAATKAHRSYFPWSSVAGRLAVPASDWFSYKTTAGVDVPSVLVNQSISSNIPSFFSGLEKARSAYERLEGYAKAREGRIALARCPDCNTLDRMEASMRNYLTSHRLAKGSILIDVQRLALTLRSEEFEHTLEADSFCIRAGAVIRIEGPSGCGKTLLVIGVLIRGARPSSVVCAESHRVQRYVPGAGMRADTWQDRNTFYTMHQAVRYIGAASYACTLDEEALSLARSWHVDAVSEKPLCSYSTGERQRLALASFVCQNANALIWILDEALSNLDAPTRDACMADVVRRADTRSITVVFVDHAHESIALTPSHRLVVTPTSRGRSSLQMI